MASTSKLVLDFDGTTGDTAFSYGYVNPELPSTLVQNLVDGLIANGSIFANPPLAIKSAKIVTTTETDIDLSE